MKNSNNKLLYYTKLVEKQLNEFSAEHNRYNHFDDGEK